MIATMTQSQKIYWDEALDKSKMYPYDFVYFLDELSSLSRTDEKQGYFIDEVFPEFRNDSRRLMRLWLSNVEVEE